MHKIFLTFITALGYCGKYYFAKELNYEKKLKAVIFNLDGVIADTAMFHYQAWKKLYWPIKKQLLS